MKQFLILLKKTLIEDPVYLGISIICILLTCINELTSLIKNTSFSGANVSLISILLFFIGRRVCKEIINRKEQKFHVSVNTFSNNYIKVASFCRNLFFLILLIPVYHLANLFLSLNSTQETCESKLKKTGLLISSFSGPKDEDDGFSSTLYGKLNSRLQYTDTVQLKLLKKNISERNENYLDTIKKTFLDNCSRSGLLVFGNRKDEKLFNCRIYSLNFLNFNAQSFRTKDKTIIYIQNPDILDFTIENEATIVSDFLYGLLYYHSGDYLSSNKAIFKALKKNKNKNNTQFISICHLFIGNNYTRQKQYHKAIAEYKDGISSDSTNSYLHYNVATIYIQTGKISEAYLEYEIAEKLNGDLKNPIVAKLKHNTNSNKSELIPISKDFKDSIEQGKNGGIQDKYWKERCFVIARDRKFGVLNSDGDTLANCKYDNIESFNYKGSDCFVLILNRKYGAVIHKHYNDGYVLHSLPTEYSIHTIYNAIEYCVDNHISRKESFHSHLTK